MSGLFEDIIVESVIDCSQSLVEVRSSSFIGEVLSLFKDKEVSSIPVFEESSDVPQTKTYIGIISVLDIVAFLLRKRDEDGVAFEKSLGDGVIKSVIGSTTESSLNISLCMVDVSTPLVEIVNKMSQGIHRFLVSDSRTADSTFHAVITQTDVVKYFLDNLDIYPQVKRVLNRPVESITSSSTEKLVSCQENSLLIKAIKKLRVHRAIPVVDSAGQIVATLSASDFWSISSSTNFDPYLTMTVQEFLSETYEGEAEHGNGVNRYRPGAAVCITSNGPILSAVEYMINHHKHRVWVVAPDDFSGLQAFGVGCISLTDVIRTIALFSTQKR